MRWTEEMRILEIMRLCEHGLSHSEIATSVNCGKTTVHDIKRRCRDAGLEYTEALGMTNEAIKARLYPKMADPPTKDDPDWEALHAWLSGNKRRNLRYAWEDYRYHNPNGLGYSQYCRRYSKWCDSTGKTVTMVQDHEPGKELYVDWMGIRWTASWIHAQASCIRHIFSLARWDAAAILTSRLSPAKWKRTGF